MGAPNPKPKKCTVVVGSTPVTIYCKPDELVPFIGTLSVDATPVETEITETVRAHTRSRYPGATPKTVKAHTAKRTVGGTLAKPTLPGNNAWFERTTGIGADKTRKVEQFTFVGPFRALKAYVKDNAVGTFTLRSPWGEPFEITGS